MPSQSFVTMVGAGNVAWHLAPALDNAGYAVREVYSRKPAHAEALTERLYQAEVCESLDFSQSASSFFILAVPDAALLPVVREIVLPEEAMLVHVSGAQPLDVLEYAATDQLGVFYPVYTFAKERRVDFSAVPICIETRVEGTEKKLITMARALSCDVHKMGSSQRLALHLSAVVASDFTNHMLRVAQQIMQRNDLDYRWLFPLIAETVQKSILQGPAAAQAGPAVQGELETLDKHFQFLEDQPALAALYQQISQHILNTYQPE